MCKRWPGMACTRFLAKRCGFVGGRWLRLALFFLGLRASLPRSFTKCTSGNDLMTESQAKTAVDQRLASQGHCGPSLRRLSPPQSYHAILATEADAFSAAMQPATEAALYHQFGKVCLMSDLRPFYKWKRGKYTAIKAKRPFSPPTNWGAKRFVFEHGI